MKRYVPEVLTPVEREVQVQQERELACEVCRHRKDHGQAWGLRVLSCKRGLQRPNKGRRCRGFQVDEEA